jgi:hypothetical protein
MPQNNQGPEWFVNWKQQHGEQKRDDGRATKDLCSGGHEDLHSDKSICVMLLSGLQ